MIGITDTLPCLGITDSHRERVSRPALPRTFVCTLKSGLPPRIGIKTMHRLVGVVAGIAIGVHAQALSAQSVCGVWTQVAPPPAATSVITHATAFGANDAWALNGVLGPIHWDGLSWAPVALPDLSGLGSAVDLAAMGSAGSALVVCGVVTTSVWTSEQLLLIWSGGRWDRVESLELAPNDFGQPRYGAPRAVDGVSVDDIWIVGTASSNPPGGPGNVVLTVQWDGSRLVEHITPGLGDRQNHLYGVAAIASDDVWAVGEFTSWIPPENGALHGMTLHWDGSGWNHVPNPTEAMDSVHLHEIAAISTDDVWVAGRSPDGPLFMHWDGSSWTTVPSPVTNGGIYQLAAIASDDVWAVDHPGQVPLISTFQHWDGSAWSVVPPPEVAGAVSVNRAGGLAAAGPCDVWAVGSIDTGTGAVPYIERLQAEVGTGATPPMATTVAELDQNVPNPFNPLTNMTFRLSQAQHVRLEVYDVAGRHVVTLVDEFRPAGLHTVTWNGRDGDDVAVASGIYLYSLLTDQETETRRMVLLR